MKSLPRPIVCEVQESAGFLDTLEQSIQSQTKQSHFLLNYPIVYIHERPTDDLSHKGKYEVYVGESNDVIHRTREHHNNALDSKKWQSKFFAGKQVPNLYVIGHPHFNKSLTLDIENRLMDYVLGMPNVHIVHNGRGNAQKEYYPSDEFEDIFSSIWSSLRKKNKDLFLPESEIRDSAIFKASPLHKLTDEQDEARKLILDRIHSAIVSNQKGQLIFVEGEAGTGKTVLMSSVFYELLDTADDTYDVDNALKCCLTVNHDEQITVYREIARKLHLTDRFGDDVVCKPTHFINSADPNKPVDVVFVDEAHLLLTQGKQSYRGENQLRDIMERAKVTVVMFDRYQILTTEQYWESKAIDQIRHDSIVQGNYIQLKNQLRMTCAPETAAWINAITGDRVIGSLPKDSTGYEIKVFDDPRKLYQAIQEKAANEKTRLSRLVATYDWDYSSIHERGGGKLWGVEIGSFFLPWNRELEKGLTAKQKRANKTLAWAEQPQTIGEVGSTFTIQGFDLCYAGVIIGPSVRCKNGKVVFDPTRSHNDKAIQQRTLSDGSKSSFADELLSHELHVLLTRGVQGLYIYACDPALRKALHDAVNSNSPL